MKLEAFLTEITPFLPLRLQDCNYHSNTKEQAFGIKSPKLKHQPYFLN